MARDHIVLVVDDDPRVCEAVAELLSMYDLNVVTFGSATNTSRTADRTYRRASFSTWNFLTLMDSTC